MKSYFRIIYMTPDGHKRSIWAQEISKKNSKFISYKVLDKFGEDTNPSEILVTSIDDPSILKIKSARMNLKYAELELI